MKQDMHEELEIPQGTTVKIENGIFTITGPKGSVQRKLYTPKVLVSVHNEAIVFEAKNATQREKRMIKSYKAHLKSMIKGVNQTHHYKLKICSGHFPMTVSVKGNVFEIKNFSGETIPRTLIIPADVSIKVDGQFVLIDSTDKELAGQTAALIEKLTRRAAFDKRIFQDGIFIFEKDGKPIK
jgi:large subunit ribosomal protein L6